MIFVQYFILFFSQLQNLQWYYVVFLVLAVFLRR